MIFESHAHYDSSKFKDDSDEIITNCYKNNVTKIVNIGADMKSSKTSVDLANKYDFVYAAVGVHPHDVKSMTEDDIETLKQYVLNEEKVVAIGEIGLDYYYDYSDRESQRKWFERQLELANELDMPVVIHSRDADQECYEIIKKYKPKKAVIHCFSGSKELAKLYVDMGYYIGVGGVVTFKNSRKLVEVVENIPLESILLETDAPYLSPEPNRGQRNDSTNIKYISRTIAKIKGISPDTVENVTFCNAMSLYNLK